MRIFARGRRDFSPPIALNKRGHLGNSRIKTAAWEAPSHDHGMASASRFDEVAATFNTNPSTEKVIP